MLTPSPPHLLWGAAKTLPLDCFLGQEPCLSKFLELFLCLVDNRFSLVLCVNGISLLLAILCNPLCLSNHPLHMHILTHLALFLFIFWPHATNWNKDQTFIQTLYILTYRFNVGQIYNANALLHPYALINCSNQKNTIRINAKLHFNLRNPTRCRWYIQNEAVNIFVFLSEFSLSYENSNFNISLPICGCGEHLWLGGRQRSISWDDLCHYTT